MTDDDSEALPFELGLAAATVLGPPVPAETLSKREHVRAFNDALRVDGIGGRIVFTRSIADLDDTVRQHIIRAIRAFNCFDGDNYPLDEHDCAILYVHGLSVMFKIDCYDLDLQCHSPDLSDPEVTRRVLTIMMADAPEPGAMAENAVFKPPLRQGKLDALWGIYAIINAFSYARLT